MLVKAPSDLEGVYRYIIESIISPQYRPKILHLMQWIAFAERPLLLTELRFALVAEKCNSPTSQRCEDAEEFIESNTRMERQVTSVSSGLVEVLQHDEVNIQLTIDKVILAC